MCLSLCVCASRIDKASHFDAVIVTFCCLLCQLTVEVRPMIYLAAKFQTIPTARMGVLPVQNVLYFIIFFI